MNIDVIPEAATYVPKWPEPDARFLRDETPPPPKLPLAEVFSPFWADWIAKAAESKSAPPDYVAAAQLAVTGSIIGNSRWASPWQGWKEPPIFWAVAIGSPSAGETPGLSAVLGPLRNVDSELWWEGEAERVAWEERAEVAKLADSAWRETTKAALKEGIEAPARPANANPGVEPFTPRLYLSNVTIEKLGLSRCSRLRSLIRMFNSSSR